MALGRWIAHAGTIALGSMIGVQVQTEAFSLRGNSPTMLFRLVVSVVSVAVLGHGAAFASDAAPCQYTVEVAGTELSCGPINPPVSLRPRGMNNLGYWVGLRNFCGQINSAELPIMWTPQSGAQALTTPPQTDTCVATSVNDLGAVAGSRNGWTGGVHHGSWACIWLEDGQFIEIPPLGGCPPASAINAMNNHNVAVGWRTSGNCVSGLDITYAFVWDAGRLVDIDPVPFGRDSAQATDVSETGVVTGYFGAQSIATGLAYRLREGRIETLNPVPGAMNSIAFGVNDGGTVVGWCRVLATQSDPTRFIPTVWGEDGQPTALPLLPGYLSGACLSINNQGMVLGSMSQPIAAGMSSNPYVLWIGGVPHSLISLIGDPPTTSSITAWALNDRGQVLCSGGGAAIGPHGCAWIMSPNSPLGDLNGDCRVDGADIAILLQAWGSSTPAQAAADLNHDGLVGGPDLGMLLGSWSPGR